MKNLIEQATANNQEQMTPIVAYEIYYHNGTKKDIIALELDPQLVDYTIYEMESLQGIKLHYDTIIIDANTGEEYREFINLKQS